MPVRLRVAVLLVVLLAAACTSTTNDTFAEDFDLFLRRFQSDAAFRSERVEAPLTVVEAGCGEDDVVEHWPRERVLRESPYPLDQSGLAAENWIQRIDRIKPEAVELVQGADESDNYVATFRFDRRKDRWFMTKVAEQSC